MKKSSFTTVHYISIDPEFAGQRIDNFLMTYLKGVPKTRIYRLLRKGEVRVNKGRAQPSYRIQAQDQVRIPPLKMDEQAPTVTPGRSLMNLLSQSILYEDKGLMVINKPSGIPVHGGSQVKLGIVEALRCMHPTLPHLELAHRLDADTSGCLILPKKRSILKEVHELLRMGKVDKRYFALTRGHWQPHELTVDLALQKGLLSSGERMVRVDPEGKSALTIFRVIEQFGEAELVEAELHTGRTHQIRVHAQSQYHPIASDEKYGDRDFNKTMREAYGSKRLFLHAHSVAFTLSTGQEIKVEAPLDADLESVLVEMRKKTT